MKNSSKKNRLRKFKQYEFTIKEFPDNIWLITALNGYDLSMLFLRSQEYYESPKFRGKSFTIVEFMDWYAKSKFIEGEEKAFTYSQDWTGFNVPSKSAINALIGAPDINIWDSKLAVIMFKIGYSTPFYLIGAIEGDEETFKHEFAHAFYTMSVKYKQEITKLWQSMSPRDRNTVLAAIKAKGHYANNVLIDESQAYMSTSEIWDLPRSMRLVANKYCKQYAAIFNTHYNG